MASLHEATSPYALLDLSISASINTTQPPTKWEATNGM